DGDVRRFARALDGALAEHGRDGPGDDAEPDLHRIDRRTRRGLADQVHEGHRARLVADGIDVREIVADYAEVNGVGVQPRKARRERADCHYQPPAWPDCPCSISRWSSSSWPSVLSDAEISESFSSELNVASCWRNSPSSFGCVGSWCCNWVTSSFRNASRPRPSEFRACAAPGPAPVVV